ncbi:MAG: pseudouridine synthase [Gammaproteobacteria bacterium]|nr:pseudouridine synthase [Gammaproteobacteria bacterium]
MTEQVRISKLLAHRGLCSRREADSYLEKGLVRVDGRIAQLGERVSPDASITLEGAAVRRQRERVTILLHKPVGYVSGQPEPGYESAHVLLTPDRQLGPGPRPPRHLAVAGRLDIDSQGLLVLTDDGRTARHLIGGQGVEKEYLVRVRRPIDDAALNILRGPLTLDGQALRPVGVWRLGPDYLRLVLTEGRKRQIRRMLQGIGHDVMNLKRVRIGDVRLGGLPVGRWRYLTADEHF